MVLCKSSFLHSHLSFKRERDDTTTTFCNPAAISIQKQKHNRPTAIIYSVTLLECPGEEVQTGNKEITLIQLSLLEEPNPSRKLTWVFNPSLSPPPHLSQHLSQTPGRTKPSRASLWQQGSPETWQWATMFTETWLKRHDAETESTHKHKEQGRSILIYMRAAL